MIHRYHGSKEGVRRALRRSLFRALVLEGKVETTLPRAKQLQRFAEELVNIAKPNTLTAKRRVFAETGQDKEVLDKLFGNIVSAISKRQSGYTRIVRLGRRTGDGTMMADVEWVDNVNEKIKDQKSNIQSKDEAPRANARGIFSPLLRQGGNPSEAKSDLAKVDKI